MKPFVLKYLPKSKSEIVGQTNNIKLLEKYILNFKKGKGIFLYGPMGSGKTASIYVLAKELNYELVEFNASDSRSKKILMENLNKVIYQKSFFFNNKIILIDELEGLSGVKDKGALKSIIDVIKISPVPIIVVSQNAYEDKFKNLRKVTNLVEYELLKFEDIFEKLKEICKFENIEFEESALKSLARYSKGDLRAAYNDLENLSSFNKKITDNSLKDLSFRDQTITIENSLFKVFRARNIKNVLGVFDSIPTDLSGILSWMEYNLGKAYLDPNDRCKAFDMLSKTDIFNGRIRKKQNYRYMSYCYAFLTAGISSAKSINYTHKLDIKRSTLPLKIWQYNIKNAKRKAISETFAKVTHMSKHECFKQVIPIFKKACENNIKFTNMICDDLELNNDEKSWLLKVQ